ncbi:BMP family ABC transporter substrate-binding protein [Candidatus Poribacteria bacterium]|nr:BMP family ABC transporter substrate-binding protein [Candidatus Poribacteria bacterium]
MRKENILRVRILITLFIACFAVIETTSAALKVGLIYDVTGRGDLSFCDAAYAGAKKAKDEWGFKLTEVTPSLSTDNELTLRRLAKLKYDLIIGVGFLFQEPMNRVASDFPDVKFALIDAIIEQPNVASLTYRAHEGTFLAGVISALKTETKQIGFIGGMKVPLVEAFEIGYRAGIQATNPDLELLADYVGVTPQAFNDPAKAKELALSQYNRGIDIILAAAGASGLGVLEAAKATQKSIIWVDSNGNNLAPGLVLTSVIKGVEISVYETIKSVQEGNFSGGLKDYGLKEGGVEYIIDDVNRDLLSKEILEQVEAFKAKIIAGDIVVPHERQ